MTVRKLDILYSLLLIALGGYVIIESISMPTQYGALGPGFFPKLLGGCLAAFAIGTLSYAVFGKKGSEEKVVAPRRDLLLIMLATAVFLALLPELGYLVTMPCYLTITGLLIVGDIRSKLKEIIATSIGATVALYALFAVLLNVPLP
jgi:hypothetical protein